MQVDAVDDIVAQDASPVAIGLGVYRSLLGQNLLDLLQIAGVRLFYGSLQAREEVRQSLVELLGVELCAAGQAECQLSVPVELHACLGSCMVGCTQLLAYVAQIVHLEQSCRDVGEHACLQGVRSLGIPYLGHLRHWVLHALGEDVLHLACSYRDGLVLQLGALAWDRGDVLLDEWQESGLVVVAHEEEGEVLGIGEHLFAQFEHAVVVDSIEVFGLRDACHLVAHVDGALQRILVNHLWVLALVGKSGLDGAQEVGSRFLVLAQRCHLEVDELHEGLDVLRSRVS